MGNQTKTTMKTFLNTLALFALAYAADVHADESCASTSIYQLEYGKEETIQNIKKDDCLQIHGVAMKTGLN